MLGKEIFELNGVPFSQPIVTATNATANSGFFNTAFIPRKDSLYFKVSVNYMNGFVPEADKSYSPSFPTEKFNSDRVFSVSIEFSKEKFKSDRVFSLSNQFPTEKYSFESVSSVSNQFLTRKCDLKSVSDRKMWF